MMIPSYITHYHLRDRQPFLSLSELDLKEQQIFDELLVRHQTDPGYRRRYGQNYLVSRKAVEAALRARFIERGGKPARKYPFYFVLGKSTWFQYLNENQSEIRILLKDLNPATASFTFPDSYVSLSSKTEPYHGKVFLLDELESFVAEYGLPNDDTSLNYERYWLGSFEKYLEVQIWEDEIVQPFIDRFREEAMAS